MAKKTKYVMPKQDKTSKVVAYFATGAVLLTGMQNTTLPTLANVAMSAELAVNVLLIVSALMLGYLHVKAK